MVVGGLWLLLGFVSILTRSLTLSITESSNPIRPITPGIINAAMSAKASGKSALHELEEMLSDMNDRMEDIEKMKHDDGVDGRARTAGVASRSGDRAIGNLVSMVNNVVED